MQSAPKPENEEQRLAELLSYDILDTEAETLFDEITLLASQICESPIALISLVDPNRQWFKSKVGLDANETSRNIAFCAHAILQDNVFEVPDTLTDERFYDNPLVTGGPKIRSYAGAPLITPSGLAVGTLCAISDKPHELSEQQRQSLATLSHSVVAQLELRRKNRELERTNQFRSDFLSYVSHEVRTPLNAINTLSALLEEEAKAHNLPANFEQSLGHIRKSGERLLVTVNSVLDMKQIEAGKMRLMVRHVSVNDFFVHLFTLMRIRVEEQGIIFQTHLDDNIPEVLEFDDTKYGQVALNVLSNAIKYTPAGKKVRVRAYFRSGELRFVVKDEGIGIAKDEQQNLFLPYERMTNAAQFEGSGLGLMITKHMVELMNGHIRLASKLNEGTTVSVSVPVRQPDSYEVKQAIGPDTVQTLMFNREKIILVVEDNEINQIVISAILEKLEISHRIVATGESCIIEVNKRRPDLILMDINLPGMSGVETTQKIKRQHPNLPVIAITADVIIGKDTLIASGLDAVLNKPIDSIELSRTMNVYLAD